MTRVNDALPLCLTLSLHPHIALWLRLVLCQFSSMDVRTGLFVIVLWRFSILFWGNLVRDLELWGYQNGIPTQPQWLLWICYQPKPVVWLENSVSYDGSQTTRLSLLTHLAHKFCLLCLTILSQFVLFANAWNWKNTLKPISHSCS